LSLDSTFFALQANVFSITSPGSSRSSRARTKPSLALVKNPRKVVSDGTFSHKKMGEIPAVALPHTPSPLNVRLWSVIFQQLALSLVTCHLGHHRFWAPGRAR